MLLVLLLYLASTTMANPPSTSRRASSSSPSSWPHSSNYNLPITDTHNQTQFQFQTPQTTRLLSSAKTFLKKPHAIPALLSVFLLLTWVCLRLQYARDPKINVGTSRFSPGGDQDANVVRFHSSSSAIAKDKRGWLMDPVSVALEAGIPGGATSCASVHIGEIRPGSLRGNHRHHFCNETILIWGAKTLFRVENSLLDKGYGEVIINADEVAVATSPRGTAHALLNLDPSKTTYILGCQDNAINHNNSSSDFNREDMEKGMKLAVLVGCNYPNTRNELHGCHNDVLAMRDLLIQKFKFQAENIVLLTDKPGSLVMPTGANIMKALHEMVDKARPDDILYFHYSGHGTLIDKSSFLPFGKEEAIVPTDFNLITSVDFRQLVNKVPKGATFTILSDSCHSGGLIDKEKQQIGPSHSFHTDNSSPLASTKLKAIPYESVLQNLAALTNINTTDVGTHLLEIFGNEASLRFRLPQIDLDLLRPVDQNQGILLSGCQTDETSADVVLERGKACGAFSNAVQQVLKENSQPLSNKQVVSMARKQLSMHQFKQHPCLYCSDENADAAFLN